MTEVTQPANGTVTILPNGTAIQYTPNSHFNGMDFFSYTITDEHGGVATAVVNLNVTPVNDTPSISDLANRFIVEGNSTGAIVFTVGDIETAPGDLLSR